MFGRAFDPQILRRIWAFVQPYRRSLGFAIAASSS
jgi:ATP-binding cassette subfamily B protein